MPDRLEMAKSRAHMKKLVNLIMTALFMHICGFSCVFPVRAQMEAQKTTSKPNDGLDENLNISPITKNGSNISEIVPQIPSPPAVALPEPALGNVPAGMALNWRSRALALANECPLKKNSVGWALPVSYGKGQLLLKQAIMQTGLTLLSEYDDAGQFLVSLPESNKKGDVIVISQPVSETSTLFKMHVYADYRVAEIARINCLPETMKNLLENHGLWQ
jgi:hypothetical protein